VPGAPSQELEQLAWMAGCWEGQGGKTRFEEQWMRPAAGSMLGMARATAGDKTVFTESLHIGKKGDEVTLTVIIGMSGKPTPFKMIRSSDKEVVFENPAHDFPQRIIYRQQADGLLGRIEGQEKGKSRSEDFPMKRARCQ